MNIISHQGLWQNLKERNTAVAFKRSFEKGFGAEADVRDWNGKLVISHGPPNKQNLSLEDLLDIYRKYGHDLPIALNIKADGIEALLERLLDKYSVRNGFAFDMSIPTAYRIYKNHKRIAFATRHSDLEPEPVLYDAAIWIWMDELERAWIKNRFIKCHVQKKKRVCVVSPELHGRLHLDVWRKYRLLPESICKSVYLCTDFPLIANSFFNMR